MFGREITIHDWIHYNDLIDIDPNKLQQIEIRGERIAERGNIDETNWTRETYVKKCVLIPTKFIDTAINKLNLWDITLEEYWENANKFFFGETKEVKGIPISQFLFERRHPIHRHPIIELRHDFVRYHVLDFKEGEVYTHPLFDNLPVVRIRHSTEEINRTKSIVIHIDFLKDYLSARKSGLLVCLAMDRFCNLEDPESVGIKAQKQTLRLGVYREISVRKIRGKNFFRVRSILWKTDVIRPYKRPKKERNFWYLPSSEPIKTAVKFHVDASGSMARLTDAETPPYLYFSRSVLERYINTPGYDVLFHMRKWGRATNPFCQGVDVGINSEGLATAFAPDISKLPQFEQKHWSSYSTIPFGEICEELFKTRMELQPPPSPGVIELFSTIRKRLDELFKNMVDKNLYLPKEPDTKALHHLSVGLLRDEWSELFHLAKILYQWVIEGMDIKVMREAVNDSLRNERNARQIRHLEELLNQRSNLGSNIVKEKLLPLRGLNSLRQMDAHLRSENRTTEALNNIGITETSSPLWKIWDSIVDKIVECFNEIIYLIQTAS